MTMDSSASPATALFNTPADSDDSLTDFEDFSTIELTNVPSSVWNIFPKKQSISIKVHNEHVFDFFEQEITALYGPPDQNNKFVNGHIYRGIVKTSDCDCPIIITFYTTTFLVRVQGAGYGTWATKVLPKLGSKVWAAVQNDNRSALPVSPTTVASSCSLPGNTLPISQSTTESSLPLFDLHLDNDSPQLSTTMNASQPTDRHDASQSVSHISPTIGSPSHSPSRNTSFSQALSSTPNTSQPTDNHDALRSVSHISPSIGSSSHSPPRNTSFSPVLFSTPNASQPTDNLKSHLPESVAQYLIQCVEQKVKHQTENKILKEQIASLEMKNADLCDDLAAKEL